MMKLLALSSVLLLPAWTPAAAAVPPSTPAFAEATEVNVVNVDVYATDKSGRRVNGLGKDDFEIREDGKPVPLSYFQAVGGGPEKMPSPAGGPAAPAPAPEAPAAEPADAMSLVVYFDNLTLYSAHRDRVLKQLHEFLARQLAPGDRVMLVTQEKGLHVRLPFTSDPAAIARGLSAIEALAAKGGEGNRYQRQVFDEIMAIQKDSITDAEPVPCPRHIVEPARAYADTLRQEVLQTISSLTLTINSLSGVPGRKALLYVSDGLPMTPGEEAFQFLTELCGGSGTSGFGTSNTVANPQRGSSPSSETPELYTVYDSTSLGPKSYRAADEAPLDAQKYNVSKPLEALAAHANAQRVTLYMLQATGPQVPGGSVDATFGLDERLYQFPSIGQNARFNAQSSLKLLAEETGGKAILDTSDFRADFAHMREDLTSFYSLGFTPSHTGDGREHKIEVRARRQGLRLRYRQSYRDKPAIEKVVDRTLAALFYDIQDNPLEITTETGEAAPAENGQYAVPVRLKIPLFKLAILSQQDKTYVGKLRLLVAVRDEMGGMAPVRQVEVPLNIPRKEVLNAMGQYYIYTLTLKLRPGLQHVAVAVRDEIATTTSYLSRPVTVNATAAVPHP
ncbi:MAG: VWA domain-containing protein [Thermoanaerobaculia bacterium]